MFKGNNLNMIFPFKVMNQNRPVDFFMTDLLCNFTAIKGYKTRMKEMLFILIKLNC